MEEEKYYCPNCEWEVTYGDPKCYNCNEELDWDKVKVKKTKVKEETEEEVEYIDEPKKKKKLYDDEKETYEFFFRNGDVLLAIFIIYGILVFISGIITSVEVDSFIPFLVSLFLLVPIIYAGVCCRHNSRFKAHLLKNICEINKNTKKR